MSPSLTGIQGAKRFFIFLALLIFVFTATLAAQPKYRTFNQNDLSRKKEDKVGKTIAVNACFTFNNTFAFAVTSLHIKFNSRLDSLTNKGGYTTIVRTEEKGIDLTGRSVNAGDSVTICGNFNRHEGNVNVSKWWWDTSGVRVGTHHEHGHEDADSGVELIHRQPNGGTVLNFLYKHSISHDSGLVVGINTVTPGVGWIRYRKSEEKKFFPHTDRARCFDSLKREESGMMKAFVGQVKNPKVRKHNNHLLGEVHALKLAIIANDSGVSQPDQPSARLGSLIYNDAGNPSDPCNNLSLRKAVHLIDSALTYCGNFASTMYAKFDSSVSRTNRAFDGPYVAVTFSPFKLAGTHTVAEVPFLHTPPTMEPVTEHGTGYSVMDPEQFELRQNYPNPFNPTTNISFDLPGSAIVTLTVYNMLGQEVATLLNREEMDGGEQLVEFDASSMPSGVYFYRVTASVTDDNGNDASFQSIKRMLLIK